jgi:hypothetical protein
VLVEPPRSRTSSGGWGCGRIWDLDWGKPLADGGGHDIDDADGVVLLLEGDIEVISPSSLPYLSRAKTQSFGLDGGGARVVPFPRWRRRFEIVGLGG